MNKSTYDKKNMILYGNSITVGELYDYLTSHIKTYGRNGEIWLESGDCLSTPCKLAMKLNCRDGDSPPISDVILEYSE